MSLTRQLLILIPLAYLFGYTIGYEAVWFAVPLAELGSVVVVLFGHRAIKKKIFVNLP
jgi:Na+-driven multidrug efflux pump